MSVCSEMSTINQKKADDTMTQTKTKSGIKMSSKSKAASKAESKTSKVETNEIKSEGKASKAESKESKAESKESEEPQINWKPGQKFPTPSPGNGDRVFYETLYQQRPDSEMAQDWVLAYGILTSKEAEKLIQKIANRGNAPKGRGAANKMKSPEKAKPVATQPPAKRARGGKATILEDADIGGDDTGGVWEGRGTSGI